MLLFLYGIQNALKLASDLYTCTIQKVFRNLTRRFNEPDENGKGEEMRKLYCLKFLRNFEVTGTIPNLSECLNMRQ
jgi:hypothetical protein